MTRAAGLLVAFAMLALIAGCGGGSSPAVTLSPIGTKATTPTPTSESTSSQTSGGVPTPGTPSLDEALTELARGDRTADLDPGAVDQIDPQMLVQGSPACTNFEFDFTWQVVDPYPPDGVSLVWQIARNGQQVTLSSDASGEQSVGCDIVQAVNNGQSHISVAIKYKIGGLSP